MQKVLRHGGWRAVRRLAGVSRGLTFVRGSRGVYEMQCECFANALDGSQRALVEIAAH